MLGTTASGLFWMFRYLERSDNTARLVETGHRMTVTRAHGRADEWTSVLTTAGALMAYQEIHDEVTGEDAVDFLLRDRANPSSVRSTIDLARANARQVRGALTREVWEATNECWMRLLEALAEPVAQGELPALLALIRRESALVQGAQHDTMLRDDHYDFCDLGTMLERANNTARILDVKYYVLLPSLTQVGSPVDNAGWETVLRSVSAHRSFHWSHPGETNRADIARFLILDRRMPRSLAHCHSRIRHRLEALQETYGVVHQCHKLSEEICSDLTSMTIDDVFDQGLHEFLLAAITDTNELAAQIESDFRFAS